jgi:hypothetical protein
VKHFRKQCTSLQQYEMSATRRDDVTGECKKLDTEQPHGLHCSPHFVRVMKCRRVRQTERVAREG